MQYSNTDKNRGAHGDSSFMLDGLPSSSENPPALAVGSVKHYLQQKGYEANTDEIRTQIEAAVKAMKAEIEW